MNRVAKILSVILAVQIATLSNSASADPVNCPNDLEADFTEALKSCGDEMRAKEAKSLLQNANERVLKRRSLVREASLVHDENGERFSRGVNLSVLKRDLLRQESGAKGQLLNLSASLLKESSDEKHVLKRDLLHELSRFKRGLVGLNSSLVKKSPDEKRVLKERSEDKNHDDDDDDDMEKEIGELIVCAVEKLIKEHPFLQKSIEECAKSNNKNDDESQKKFEKCVEDRVKQMCPKLKLN